MGLSYLSILPVGRIVLPSNEIVIPSVPSGRSDCVHLARQRFSDFGSTSFSRHSSQ
jgi:hypothetical protein